MVDGRWYCSEMPLVLVNAERDFREHKIDEGTRDARILARERCDAQLPHRSS